MILLDTNVVSELMRSEPENAVEAWARSQRGGSLYFSTVSEAELRYGAAILPEGRRRETLFADIEGMLRSAFGDRVLSFAREAAHIYGDIAAMRRSAGLHIEAVDCQIAAIASAHGLTVATRNVGDFAGMGVELINPWAAT